MAFGVDNTLVRENGARSFCALFDSIRAGLVHLSFIDPKESTCIYRDYVCQVLNLHGVQRDKMVQVKALRSPISILRTLRSMP